MSDTKTFINPTLLQMKFSRVINLLATTLETDLPSALDVFYRSQTYKDLMVRENGLHNFSDRYLADELMLELQARQ